MGNVQTADDVLANLDIAANPHRRKVAVGKGRYRLGPAEISKDMRAETAVLITRFERP